MRLRKLFEFVGDRFGIAVEVITTDGRQPIGNGIGPVLERSDVMAVLTNEAGAPTDLREKSLRLAAHLLEYDSAIARRRRLCPRQGTARQRRRAQADAKDHRSAGAVRLRRRSRILTADVPTPHDGVVEAVDCLQLNRLARTAGAPIEKGAGIKVFKKMGDWVDEGEPLYRIHAVDQSEFDLVRAGAKADAGYVVGNAHVAGGNAP